MLGASWAGARKPVMWERCLIYIRPIAAQELAAEVARMGAALAEEAAAAGVSLPAAQGMLRELQSAAEAAGAKLGSPPVGRVVCGH